MDKKAKLIGRSTQTPIENKERKVVALPGKKSKDFIVNARCRILNVGARTSLSASDLPGDEPGTFTWSTNSNKIRIVNSSGPVVAIEALLQPSTARDQETITVVRTSSSGLKSEKTVKLTVARIKFGPTNKQSYGYDDYDTPAIVQDHHVSVGASDSTFIAVNIEGGAIGTDFDFVFDDETVCKVGKVPDSSGFDLSIQAVTGVKRETVLRAKAKCPSQPEFSRIFVNVYPKKTVDVLVAKVADKNSIHTTLRFPLVNYALHQDAANKKLRDAVVQFRIQNFDSANKVTDVTFDVETKGVLAYDINEGGGKALEMIDKVIGNSTGKYRVVIVKKMKSYYYLSRPAKKGDKEIFVKGDNIFKSEMILGTGDSKEDIIVAESMANVGYLASPLTKDHPSGEPVEFPAAGWSSDPIVICEGEGEDESLLDTTKWTIIHEVGHAALDFLDVVDPTNLMHFSQDNSDNKLRHCPRVRHYSVNEKENQWETIPRDQKSVAKD